jgi:hypothetical protein
MRIFQTRKIIFFALTLLSACDLVGGGKRKTSATQSDPETNVVIPYFVSTRYAIDLQNAPEALSSFSGQIPVATADSTFKNWTEPKYGCKFSSDDGVAVTPIRAIDLGKLFLRGPGIGEVAIPNGGSPNFDYWAGGLAFTLGQSYSLQPQGSGGTLNFIQAFKVLNHGTGLTIQNSSAGSLERIPAPTVPASSDPDYTIQLDRTDSASFNYTAPEGTNYVRILLSDGSSSREGSVICYGSPKGPISIPALPFFKATGDGFMSIDFVSLSRRTDVSPARESIVLSITRQVHGRMDFYMDGTKVPFYFGKLNWQ